MRTLLFIKLICGVLFLFCTSFKTPKEGKSKLEFSAKLGKWKTADSLPVFIALKNTTTDTIEYVTMTCFWFEFYSLDVKDLGISGWACDRNFEILHTIFPKSSEEKTIGLTRRSFQALNDFRFRIGFNYQTNLDAFFSKRNGELFFEKTNPETNILWSDTLYLK